MEIHPHLQQVQRRGRAFSALALGMQVGPEEDPAAVPVRSDSDALTEVGPPMKLGHRLGAAGRHTYGSTMSAGLSHEDSLVSEL